MRIYFMTPDRLIKEIAEKEAKIKELQDKIIINDFKYENQFLIEYYHKGSHLTTDTVVIDSHIEIVKKRKNLEDLKTNPFYKFFELFGVVSHKEPVLKLRIFNLKKGVESVIDAPNITDLVNK